MQTWQPEDLLLLNLQSLRCEVCGRGDDETYLLICDGCDRGFHTHCTGLQDIPAGEGPPRMFHSLLPGSACSWPEAH